jgi:8-oxo-dGTP diphosphatase
LALFRPESRLYRPVVRAAFLCGFFATLQRWPKGHAAGMRGPLMPCHARLALTRLGGDTEAGANRKIGRKSELGSYGRGPEVKETRDRVCGGGVLIRAVDHGRDESALVLLGGRAANREFYPDVWDVPGGHVEPGETGEQALVRELREEIGVMPTAWVSLGEFCEPHPGGEGSMALHLYAVTSWEGAPRNLSPEEHSEIWWFAVEDAHHLTLAHPSYPEIWRGAASLVSGAGRRGCTALTIASSGWQE